MAIVARAGFLERAQQQVHRSLHVVGTLAHIVEWPWLFRIHSRSLTGGVTLVWDGNAKKVRPP
jgi:hypothetical protein